MTQDDIEQEIQGLALNAHRLSMRSFEIPYASVCDREQPLPVFVSIKVGLFSRKIYRRIGERTYVENSGRPKRDRTEPSCIGRFDALINCGILPGGI